MKTALNEKCDGSKPIAAIVIEPTNAQTGYTASESFMGDLASLARENDAALVVDETNTCCGASGKGFWQHSGSADYVAFGKRMQVAGFFSDQKAGRRDLNLADNMLGLQTFQTISQVLKERDLSSQVERVGNALDSQIQQAEASSQKISGITRVGTSMWIDTASGSDAHELHAHLRDNGVLTKLNGHRGVMTKPALVLESEHSAPLMQALRKF